MGWERSDRSWVNSKRSGRRRTTRGSVRQYHVWDGRIHASTYRDGGLILPVVEVILTLSAIVVQSLSCIQLFATPWTAARQASLSLTISSLLKLRSVETVMPSNHLNLGRTLLLLPSIFPSIRVFSSELTLRIRWPTTLFNLVLKLLVDEIRKEARI